MTYFSNRRFYFVALNTDRARERGMVFLRQKGWDLLYVACLKKNHKTLGGQRMVGPIICPRFFDFSAQHGDTRSHPEHGS